MFEQRLSRTFTFKTIAGLGVFILVAMGWTCLSLWYFMPALWGPYVHVLADAGPLVLSRGGSMIVFMGLPMMALTIPISWATSRLNWIVWQSVWLVILGASFYGYGWYLHHIVKFQGLDISVEMLALEVGFDGPSAVPAHIKQALQLSETLAKEGRAPWQPFAWKGVTWPAIPQKI